LISLFDGGYGDFLYRVGWQAEELGEEGG